MAQAGVAYRSVRASESTRPAVAVRRRPSQTSAAARMRRERIERTNRMMLRITAGLIIASLFVYIGRMASISANAKEIAKIRREITQLQEEQQYLEVKLAARQDLERVRDEAMGRLGMGYPVEGQVQLVSLGSYVAGSGTQTVLDNATP